MKNFYLTLIIIAFSSCATDIDKPEEKFDYYVRYYFEGHVIKFNYTEGTENKTIENFWGNPHCNKGFTNALISSFGNKGEQINFELWGDTIKNPIAEPTCTSRELLLHITVDPKDVNQDTLYFPLRDTITQLVNGKFHLKGSFTLPY